MRPKYIDERFRHYFIFGTSPTGKVDLNDGQEDICTVHLPEANKLIKDRNEVLKLIHIINKKYPKEFEDCLNSL